MSSTMDAEGSGNFPIKVREAQSLLAAYCLDKDRKVPKRLSLSNRKALPHYRRLIQNIFEDCLERAFPIAYSFLKGVRWKQLVKDFTAKHACQTPQMMRTPYEFYLFVKERFDRDESYRFLIELCYFEWLEIDLHVMPDAPSSQLLLSDTYTQEGLVVINPEYKTLLLKYPFHRLPPAKAKDVPGAYHLLLYRCPDTGDVNFLQINPIFAWVVDCLSQNSLSVRGVVDLLAETLGDKIDDLDTFAQKIEDFIVDLHSKKVVRGFVLNKKA